MPSRTLTTANDIVTFNGKSSNTVTCTIGAGATLTNGDRLTGGSGTDTLVISGSGIFDLNSLATFTGFEAITLSGSGKSLTLKNGQNLSVSAGSGNTITLGTGDDTVSFTGGANTVNGSIGVGATLNSSERLAGGTGIDTLNISGSGSFDLNSLGVFTGFENVNLTGTGQSLILRNGQNLNVSGGSGNAITLGTGNDAVSFTGGTNTINAAAGTFNSGDNLTGGAGADQIVLTRSGIIDFTTGTLSGIETLIGSSGDDGLSLSAAQFAAFSTIDLGSGAGDYVNVGFTGMVDISAANNPTLTDVEGRNLIGSSADDSITLTGAQLNAFTSSINLAAGTDTLNLNSTSTVLNGLADGSLINVEAISADGAAAGVTINLGSQSEAFTITGSGSNDTLDGGDGNDTIDGGDGDDIIKGAAGNDTVYGGLGNDSIEGGAGDDVLYGGDGNDFIDGASGAFFGAGGPGNDIIDLGAGNDVSWALVAAGGTITEYGGDGNDFIALFGATAASGTIDGGSGFDFLQAQQSGDISTLTITNFETLITYNSFGNPSIKATAAQFESFDTIVSYTAGHESDAVALTLAAAGSVDLTDELLGRAVTFTGSSGDDGIITSNGNDTINGLDGNDTLDGGDGNDTIDGGDGDDIIKGAAGNDTVYGGLGNDSIEGGAGDDVLYGGDGNDFIDGASGAFFGAGGPGNDIIDLGAGNDVSWALVAAGGTITEYGGDGNDFIALFGATAASGTIDGGSGFDFLQAQQSGDISTLTITNFETLITYNSFGNPSIKATAAQFESFDTIVSYTAGHESDAVALTLAAAGSVDLTDELLGRAVTFTGSSGDDGIITSNGNDTINGLDGNDTLSGELGDDTIYGGFGDDIIVFGDYHGADTVRDYADGSDRFDVTDVAGVHTFADLALTDTGSGVEVDYGTGDFLISNANIAMIDASDFIFA